MSANNISNNKISNIINSQVPFFVRNDHQKFVQFLEAYYRYLEQNEKVINRIKNVQKYYDIDVTEDIFAERMYKIFLKNLPESSKVDRNLLLKHVKDFYRSRGTEKSVRFLLNILFAELPYSIYYPKQDVLRASDGKWYVKKTLRITDVHLDSNLTTQLTDILNFTRTRIVGNTSGASALVEGVDRFYETNVLVDELVLSNIDGNFENGEQIFTKFDGAETEQYLSANVFGGQLYDVKILQPGSLYTVGTQVPLENQGTGSGAIAIITKVSTGTVKDIAVIYGGTGYQANGEITITSLGGTGSGAKANVYEVQTLGIIHPNSYNVMYSTISLVANDILDYANVYTTLNNSNVNTTIANAASFWQYSNTGPIVSVLVLDSGTNYQFNPSITAVSNTTIVSLGILGRMAILEGGVGYEANDKIEFENVIGGFGFGARGNVLSVNSTGGIISVGWDQVPGQYIGGSGYTNDKLPKANVISQNTSAFGANIMVVSILGTGASLISSNSSIGGVEEITLISKGAGYTTTPTLNLQSLGDGTALANVSVLPGTFSYPGRYLNDDGHISSYNFLQDRDYYQSFSYVIRSGHSVEEYRDSMKDLVHPAGMRMFGEYDLIRDDVEHAGMTDAVTEKILKYKANVAYQKVSNTINISYNSHNLYVGNTVYLDFTTGNLNAVKDGIYSVNTVIDTDTFSIVLSYGTDTSGNVDVGKITT